MKKNITITDGDLCILEHIHLNFKDFSSWDFLTDGTYPDGTSDIEELTRAFLDSMLTPPFFIVFEEYPELKSKIESQLQENEIEYHIMEVAFDIVCIKIGRKEQYSLVLSLLDYTLEIHILAGNELQLEDVIPVVSHEGAIQYDLIDIERLHTFVYIMEFGIQYCTRDNQLDQKKLADFSLAGFHLMEQI
ncbi:hypothetical protein [Bacillus sp. FJAT-52991]|uniref:Uncharacterized protein n=1 Tax=Bacillus kandeliae TaxID=3129297 RepID=A0ABZ2NBR1_9BACI